MQPIAKFSATSILQPGAVDKANQVIDIVNGLAAMQVKVTNAGVSRLDFGTAGQPAVLTISTRDIVLASVTGSKGSNAALASLMSALSVVFTVRDSTT